MKIKCLVLSVMVSFASGCGNSVNSVKDATLKGREQTTIGNAFGARFDEARWELKRSANKTQFVEFAGKSKTKIPFPTPMVPQLVIPQGGVVMVQFILKRNGAFEIGYAEAAFAADPSLPEELKKPVNELLNVSGIKTDGTASPIQPDGVNILLDGIYRE